MSVAESLGNEPSGWWIERDGRIAHRLRGELRQTGCGRWLREPRPLMLTRPALPVVRFCKTCDRVWYGPWPTSEG